MSKYLYSFLLLFACFDAPAQDSTIAKKVQLKLGVNYNSNLHFYGRTDSLQSSGLIPSAELWIGSHFYLSAAPIFVHNKTLGTDYAGTIATLGYLKATEKNLVHMYLLKPTYTKESRLVQSILKAQAGVAVSWLSPLINIGIAGDVKYSNSLDVGTSATIDHLLRLPIKKSVLVIDPSLALNAGTQSFLRTYRQKKGGILFPREEAVLERTKVFGLLSAEASVPFIYVQGKLQGQITPAYVVPMNVQAAQDQAPAAYGRPLFYTTLGLKYTF